MVWRASVSHWFNLESNPGGGHAGARPKPLGRYSSIVRRVRSAEAVVSVYLSQHYVQQWETPSAGRHKHFRSALRCCPDAAGLSTETLAELCRQLRPDDQRQFDIRPAFWPISASAQVCCGKGRVSDDHDPAHPLSAALCSAATRPPPGCDQIKECHRQVVSVLLLSAHDAMWPLLTAAQPDGEPAAQTAPSDGDPAAQTAPQNTEQPSNGRFGQEHAQPAPAIDLAQQLVRVAGPAAALEPHIVLVRCLLVNRDAH